MTQVARDRVKVSFHQEEVHMLRACFNGMQNKTPEMDALIAKLDKAKKTITLRKEADALEREICYEG